MVPVGREAFTSDKLSPYHQNLKKILKKKKKINKSLYHLVSSLTKRNSVICTKFTLWIINLK